MASILRGEPHKDSTSVNFHLSSLSLDFWGTYHRWVKICFYIGNNQVGVYFIWCLSVLRLHWVHQVVLFLGTTLQSIWVLANGWCERELMWCWEILRLESFHQIVSLLEQLFKFLPKVGRKGASWCDVEEAVDHVEEKDQEAQETKKGVWVECIPELRVTEMLSNVMADHNHPPHSTFYRSSKKKITLWNFKFWTVL